VASKVASKVARVAKVVAKRVVSRATANLSRSGEVSSNGLTSHCEPTSRCQFWPCTSARSPYAFLDNTGCVNPMEKKYL